MTDRTDGGDHHRGSTNGASGARRDGLATAAGVLMNDQTLADLNQTMADSDQTHADSDQTAADGDQSAADNDQAAADNDQAASDRDLVHGGNPVVHDASRVVRDRSAQQRHDTATERAEAAAARDHDAHARDLTASERDLTADLHDRAVAARDTAETAGGSEGTSAQIARRAAQNRKGAAEDRVAAAQGRARAAVDRRQAAEDREQAARDRAQAIADREALLLQLVIAETDQLTGARTRQAGLADLDHEIDRARRTDGRLVVVYVDVVGLKAVNDTLGHAAGDTMLRRAIQEIRGHLRSYDLIVRVGGDEFLCVMSAVRMEDARERFATVQTALSADPGQSGIKIGLAALTPADSAAQLIERADAELPISPRRSGASPQREDA